MIKPLYVADNPLPVKRLILALLRVAAVAVSRGRSSHSLCLDCEKRGIAKSKRLAPRLRTLRQNESKRLSGLIEWIFKRTFAL